MNAALRQELGAVAEIEVRFDEPMADHTTYKVGGPAAAWIDVRSVAGLQAVLAALAKAEVPYLVVGNGSNVLFADAGYAGAVLHLGRGLDDWHVERDVMEDSPAPHRLQAGAALTITKLLRAVKQANLQGLECLGGVPGTVGGAVRMNAGTVMGELKDALEAAQLVLTDGTVAWWDAALLNLSYRHSELPDGAIVVAARFRLKDADEEMRKKLEEVLAYRKATQPLTMPSCGSVFANPEGDAAGRLIEEAGLKGRTVGGAQVSEQHANWIVNTGGARARDVRDLIRLCQDEVEAKFAVKLRPEVRMLGDWDAEGDA